MLFKPCNRVDIISIAIENLFGSEILGLKHLLSQTFM